MIQIAKKHEQGFILFTSVALTLCATVLVSSFIALIPSEMLRVDYKIAETKALYNAETGIAEKGYPFIIRSEFVQDTVLLGQGEVINNFTAQGYNHGVDMGGYLPPELNILDNGDKEAIVEGFSFIRTADGTLDSIKTKVSVSVRPETLAKYMYLTDSEKAGGAPWSYGGSGYAPTQRRDVFFGSGDILDGIVQSNTDISMSNFGCPDFSDAQLYMTYNTETQLGGCNGYSDLFNSSDIDTVSSPPVNLPPSGYETLKNNATIVYDSGRKLGGGSLKDTLIMTDIEFFETGRVSIKQWWYLMPPHLKAGTQVGDLLLPTPEHLDGVVSDANGNLFYNNDGDTNPFDNPLDCSNFSDLRTCEPYIDSLYYYHAKGYSLDGSLTNMPDEWYNASIGGAAEEEELISSVISGSHGMNQHYDFEPLNDSGNPNASSLLIDAEYNISAPTVIYIKDGPVRVHGFYKGQYTVVTDEHTTYRRHAWNSPFNVKEDTVWNNIWIVDDLVNVDAMNQSASTGPSETGVHQHGNLSASQPDQETCNGGSNNVMGLVSGANIVIANTPANGARNSTTNNFGGDDHISINAALLALNESFVMHYWQNTTSESTGFQSAPERQILADSGEPPFGDGRGIDIYGNTNTIDKRGEIYLWGSVVQKHRGYMLRGNPSPYGNLVSDIGMDKNYHYDQNLFCISPPFYPAVEYSDGTGEIGVKLTSFRSID